MEINEKKKSYSPANEAKRRYGDEHLFIHSFNMNSSPTLGKDIVLTYVRETQLTGLEHKVGLGLLRGWDLRDVSPEETLCEHLTKLWESAAFERDRDI